MHIVSRVGIGKIPPLSPLYLDVGGAVNFDSTLRVIGQTTVNSLISSQLAANTLVYESRIEGELNVLFSINRDGALEWGAGGVSIPDANLYRVAINTLRTNASFIIDNSLIVGDTTADTATFNARISSNFDPATTNTYSLGQDTLRWQNLWLSVKLTSVDGLFTGDLQVDGNTTIGSASTDTLAVNARVSTSVVPSVDNLNNLGSLSQRWASLWLGSDLQVDGNTILGDANTDTLTLNARVATSVVPSSDNLNNLGGLAERWASLWLGSDLQVDGNTILGDSPSDTVTINAGFASPLNPSVDNFYDLGTFDYRWKQIHAGPAGIAVRNDPLDTDKVSLMFDSGIAFLVSSSAIPLHITTGINNGLIVDTSGRIGVNTTAPLTHNFTVDGTSEFLDTAYFNKPTGFGLQVESIAAIKGSIESGNAQKQLNIGSTSYTETINIGTGLGKTTINIGGPSDIININGTVTTSQTIQSFVSDKTISLNVGGLNNTAQNSGLLIEEADSVLLPISDPTWQSGNTIKYSAANTGNLETGSIVLISGFFNPENNGQFVVTNCVPNSFIEIENENRSNNSLDELSTGQFTNPVIAAKILLSSDRNSWDFFSASNPSNYFKLTNLGANAELKATVDGLAVASSALIPDISNTPLGSFTKQWNAHINDLTVYGESIIGNAGTDQLTINSATIFNGFISSNVIPSLHETYDLGTGLAAWQSIYTKNLYSSYFTQLTGSVLLGIDETTTINAAGLFTSSLIPADSIYDLGSATTPWNNLYINKIVWNDFTPGSVLFINSLYEMSEDNTNFFWDSGAASLYIGHNTGVYALDVAVNSSNSIKLQNTVDFSAIALNVNTTSTKIEFTSALQFGADTYVNVGEGLSTAVMELTSTQVKLLGAVSVNSVSVGLATYVVQPTDVIINVDTMSSGCTITLPSAATKRLLIIKDIGNNASATGRSIQLAPASNQYVEFNAINTSYVLDRDGESVTIQSDGVNRWYII